MLAFSKIALFFAVAYSCPETLDAQNFQGQVVNAVRVDNQCNSHTWTIEPATSPSVSSNNLASASVNGGEMTFHCNNNNIRGGNQNILIQIPAADLKSIDISNQVTVEVKAGFTGLDTVRVSNQSQVAVTSSSITKAYVTGQSTLWVEATGNSAGVQFTVNQEATGYLIGTVASGSSVDQQGHFFVQGTISGIDVNGQSDLHVKGGSCSNANVQNQSSCQSTSQSIHMPQFN